MPPEIPIQLFLIMQFCFAGEFNYLIILSILLLLPPSSLLSTFPFDFHLRFLVRNDHFNKVITENKCSFSIVNPIQSGLCPKFNLSNVLIVSIQYLAQKKKNNDKNKKNLRNGGQVILENCLSFRLFYFLFCIVKFLKFVEQIQSLKGFISIYLFLMRCSGRVLRHIATFLLFVFLFFNYTQSLLCKSSKK